MNKDYIESFMLSQIFKFAYSIFCTQSFFLHKSRGIFSWKSIRLRQNYIDTMQNVKLRYYAGHSHEINNDRSRRTDIKIASRKIVTR